MLTRPVLAALVSICFGFPAQASELSPQLPSLALNPPSPPSASGPYDEQQFTPYAIPSIGSAKTPADLGANRANPSNPRDTTKPRPGGLDYDLGNNVHMHLSIAGAAAAGGAISH